MTPPFLVPAPPPTPTFIYDISPRTAQECWQRFLHPILLAAWREKSITLDMSGHLTLYARLSDQDRSLLGINNARTQISEIWIATNPLTAETIS